MDCHWILPILATFGCLLGLNVLILWRVFWHPDWIMQQFRANAVFHHLILCPVYICCLRYTAYMIWAYILRVTYSVKCNYVHCFLPPQVFWRPSGWRSSTRRMAPSTRCLAVLSTMLQIYPYGGRSLSTCWSESAKSLPALQVQWNLSILYCGQEGMTAQTQNKQASSKCTQLWAEMFVWSRSDSLSYFSDCNTFFYEKCKED